MASEIQFCISTSQCFIVQKLLVSKNFFFRLKRLLPGKSTRKPKRNFPEIVRWRLLRAGKQNPSSPRIPLLLHPFPLPLLLSPSPTQELPHSLAVFLIQQLTFYTKSVQKRKEQKLQISSGYS